MPQGRGGITFAVAAYNLIRIPKLLAQASACDGSRQASHRAHEALIQEPHLG